MSRLRAQIIIAEWEGLLPVRHRGRQVIVSLDDWNKYVGRAPAAIVENIRKDLETWESELQSFDQTGGRSGGAN